MELTHLLSIGLPVQVLGARSVAAAASTPVEKGLARSAPAKPAAAGDKAVAETKASKEAKKGEEATPAPRPMSPLNAKPGGPAAAKTGQVYLSDTYKFEHTATLLDVWEEGDKVCLELDATIFHPQGGGQPSDVGTITAAGLPPLEVVFVQMDKTKPGVVRHDCRGDLAAWTAAAQKRPSVSCQVDGDKRRLFARLHSAGHLLDVAVYNLGFRWKPGKGYHFPDGPYVEYIMTDEGRAMDTKDPKAKQAVLDELAVEMRRLVANASATEATFVDGVRTVAMEGVACGCGGTHVAHSGELGEVTIKKLTAKSGNMRVSYAMN